MANVIKMVIQFRRAHTSDWEIYKDKIPAEGEPCYDLDLHTLKIGDGETTYENLPVIGGGNVTVAADGKSVVLEDSLFQSMGFDADTIGAQKKVNADGSVEWIVPSTKVIEDLHTSIVSLQSDVDALGEILGTIEDGAEGTLLDRIAAVENDVDVLNGDEYTEGSVLKIVKDEINAFATRIGDEGVVDSYKDLIDYVAEHDDAAAAMIEDISELQSRVDQLDGKVVDDTLIAKLDAIEEGAQVNKIEAINLGETVLEIADKKVVIPVGAGLKASDEITIAADGTLGLGAISWSKIVQAEGETVTFDGGGAAG